MFELLTVFAKPSILQAWLALNWPLLPLLAASNNKQLFLIARSDILSYRIES